MKFSRIISKIRQTLKHPDSEELHDHYDAIVELQGKVNHILDNIQPNVTYPTAEELSLIRYHNRFDWLMEEIVCKASRDHSRYRFYLTSGHPESERLHRVEIDKLKKLGYRVRITIDDDYEAIISW
jgi:hypothetical protein